MTSPSLPHVKMYCDGACSGNGREGGGRGGWAFLLVWNGQEKTSSGAEAATTNNRMELLAAINGLKSLTKPAKIEVYSDSQYVIKGISEWLPGWKKRGWRTADNKPVANAELWQALEAAAARHSINWHWVRGHNGHPQNERVDKLAVAARDGI
jgi:ribonuclease HI